MHDESLHSTQDGQPKWAAIEMIYTTAQDRIKTAVNRPIQGFPLEEDYIIGLLRIMEFLRKEYKEQC